MNYFVEMLKCESVFFLFQEGAITGCSHYYEHRNVDSDESI